MANQAILSTGFKELDRALSEFTPRLQKKITRKVLRRTAKPVLDDAKARARKISDRVAKLLAIRALRTRKRGVLGVKVVTTRTAEAADGGVINPHWFEFGVPGHLAWGKHPAPLKPRPFVRPAMDAQRATVSQVFRKELRTAIEEVRRDVSAKKLAALKV